MDAAMILKTPTTIWKSSCIEEWKIIIVLMQKVPCKTHAIHVCIHTQIPTYLPQKCAGYITTDEWLGSLKNKLQCISNGCAFVSEE